MLLNVLMSLRRVTLWLARLKLEHFSADLEGRPGGKK
jgi:hypothetical protein